MPAVVDTNVLIRRRDRDSTHYESCETLFSALMNRQHGLAICAQVMIEYWVVATRPANVRGLGLTPEQAAADLADFERIFPCLPEPADLAVHWRRVVTTHQVSGKPAHDARLVALMQAHGIGRLITLNPADFARYGIECLMPRQVLERMAAGDAI